MPEPLPLTRGILTAIILLSMSSGFIDAVVYTLHGHVFAYAMTGNLVLLGVALSTHHPSDIVRHLLPLVSFAAGVVLGKALLRFRPAVSLHVTLLLQLLILGLLGAFADRISSELLVAILAVSGAVLITTVRRVGDIPINITFMTGNLRASVEGAFDAVLPRNGAAERRGALQAGLVGFTCAGFLTGAAFGVLSLQHIGNRSFWIAGLLLLSAAWLLRNANTA